MNFPFLYFERIRAFIKRKGMAPGRDNLLTFSLKIFQQKTKQKTIFISF